MQQKNLRLAVRSPGCYWRICCSDACELGFRVTLKPWTWGATAQPSSQPSLTHTPGVSSMRVATTSVGPSATALTHAAAAAAFPCAQRALHTTAVRTCCWARVAAALTQTPPCVTLSTDGGLGAVADATCAGTAQHYCPNTSPAHGMRLHPVGALTIFLTKDSLLCWTLTSAHVGTHHPHSQRSQQTTASKQQPKTYKHQRAREPNPPSCCVGAPTQAPRGPRKSSSTRRSMCCAMLRGVMVHQMHSGTGSRHMSSFTCARAKCGDCPYWRC